MNYGVTPQGFVRKSRSQILASQQANSRLLLGNDIDLSDQSPDGLRLQAQTDELELLWQTLEDVYYSNFVSTAIGINLDRAMQIGGQERAQPKRSIVPLKFGGSVAAPIPSGVIVQTPQGIQFITIASGEIEGTGFGIALGQCLQFGEVGNVPSSSITEILTATTGLDTVVNESNATQGRMIETDLETYTRYKERGVSGGSSAASVQSNLNNMQSVITAKVFENAESIEDMEGRPPHSMQAVIEGATPEEIGELFLKIWPGGIKSIGNESITVQDNKSLNRTYYYDRPEDVRVYAKLTIVTNSSYVGGSDVIIKTNCIKVSGGADTIAANTIHYPGKGIGEPLYSWELEAAQLGIADFNTVRVSGIASIDIKIGLTNAPADIVLAASGSQRFKLSTEDIEIVFI